MLKILLAVAKGVGLVYKITYSANGVLLLGYGAYKLLQRSNKPKTARRK
jgi:hypothetical protein